MIITWIYAIISKINIGYNKMYTLHYKNKKLSNLSKLDLHDWTTYLDYKKITYIIK